MFNDIENPILSGGHPQETTYEARYLCDCNNAKCNEEVYSNLGKEYEGFLYCSHHCIGEHLESEGIVIDLEDKY